MPAAALGAGLVELAFALAAISAALLIRQLVVSPIRTGSIAAGGIPVIGGAIAWVLWNLANIVELGLNTFVYLAEIGKQQAIAWWNWLVGGTVAALFGWYLSWVQWFVSQAGAISFAAANFSGVFTTLYWNAMPRLSSVESAASGIWGYVVGTLAPYLVSVDARVHGIEGYINNVELPWVRSIGDDLAGLHRWIDTTLVPGIDATLRQLSGRLTQAEAEIQARALQRDLVNAQDRIKTLEGQMAALASLGIIAALATAEIENLRCVAGIDCSALSFLANANLDARLTFLETDHG